MTIRKSDSQIIYSFSVVLNTAAWMSMITRLEELEGCNDRE
jgi:hypothetical protein